MKKLFIVLIAGVTVVLFLSAFTGDSEMASDYAAVEQAVQYYFDGLDTNDPALLKKAFYSEAQLMAIRNGSYSETPFENWIKNFGPKKPSGGDKLYEIMHLDVAGTAALVKTHLEYPNVTYYDYLALLKIDGNWKIVNKSYHAIPK